MKTPLAFDSFRWPIAAAVFTAHLAALAALGAHLGRTSRIEDTSATPTTAFIVAERRPQDRLPIPEITLQAPKVDMAAIALVQFEAEEWGDISGVVAPASAPQLSRFQPVDSAAFAKRAGLPRGLAASVILTIEVLADGNVGVVEVARSYGDPAVDAAAVAYARSLKWIPGTQDHHAEVMRVNVPVTLVWTV